MTPLETTRFDSFPGTILITNTEGVVVYTNKTIERRHGFQTTQVVGRKAGALWGKQMPLSFYQELWSTIAVHKRPYISSITNKKKTGSLQEDALHIAPILDAQNKPTYFMELHPHLEQEEYLHFGDEFVHLWSDPASQEASIALPWIARWIGRTPPEHNPLLTHKSTASYLSETFVIPLQEALHERQSDKILIEAAQQDPREFRAVYEKYQQKILDYFFHRINKDADSAHDLTQETFVRAFRALPSFRATNAHYGTYLMRIAHNLLMNQYRTYRPVIYDTSVLARLGCEPTYEREEPLFTQKEVWHVVESLTKSEKEIMKMKYEDDMHIGEIASILNKSENAVKLSLTRARQKIRQRLNAHTL